LLIRDVYPKSWIPDLNFFHPGSQILDQNFFHPGSLIPDLNFFHPRSWIRIKEFKYFNKKNGFSPDDPGLPSQIRIPDLDPDFLPILDPAPGPQIPNSGLKKAPDP
jgi:hypothetical protein